MWLMVRTSRKEKSKETHMCSRKRQEESQSITMAMSGSLDFFSKTKFVDRSCTVC